jgi:hypothetical protein
VISKDLLCVEVKMGYGKVDPFSIILTEVSLKANLFSLDKHLPLKQNLLVSAAILSKASFN